MKKLLFDSFDRDVILINVRIDLMSSLSPQNCATFMPQCPNKDDGAKRKLMNL